MNPKRILIQKNLLVMAELYGKTLSESTITFFTDALIEFEINEISEAFKKYVYSEKSKSFPSIGEIRGLIKPETNSDAEAREASARIGNAIIKYGYTQPEKAKEYVGELGWCVVEREGGWQSICETTMTEDLPILKSQWRELAKALRSRADIGKLNEGPKLFKNEEDRIKNEKPFLVSEIISKVVSK